MVIFTAHLEARPGTLALEELSRVSHLQGVPVLVDAAYMNDPTSVMSSFLPRGADLVCFSAKYFWGPNSGGLICGRCDLIEAVAGIDFKSSESGKYLTFGPPSKMHPHTIVATLLTLQKS